MAPRRILRSPARRAAAKSAASSPASNRSSPVARRRMKSDGGSGRGGRSRRGRSGSGSGLMWGGGGFVLLILIVIGSRVACSASIMSYQDSQFKDAVKSVAQETDDPEYWCFLVDEYHDRALSGCMRMHGRTAQYDPDIYERHLVDLLRQQINHPDPAVLARFKQRYGREPRLGATAQ